MVHGHDPLDAVRRLTRVTRPALAPLRAAAATLQPSGGANADELAAAPGEPSSQPSESAEAIASELEELAAMRDQLTDAATEDSSERAERATRSASAYLEARRARLKRELRQLGA